MVSSSDDVLDVIREQRRAYEPFTPLTDDEVKRAVQAIQNAIGEWGSDRLHAQWARHVLENTERNVLATVGAGDRHVTKMCQYCGCDYYDLASHLSERHGIDMPSVGDRPPDWDALDAYMREEISLERLSERLGCNLAELQGLSSALANARAINASLRQELAARGGYFETMGDRPPAPSEPIGATGAVTMILDSPEREILEFLHGEDMIAHKRGNPNHILTETYLAARIAYIVRGAVRPPPRAAPPE